MFQKWLQRIKDSTELQHILQNIGWLFFDKIFRYGIGFFVGLWAMNYLGTARLGILNQSTSFTFLFGSIATLGLSQIVIRELVKSPEQEDELLGSAFMMMFLAGLLTFCLTVASAYVFYQDDWQTFILIAIISVGFVFQGFHAIIYYYESKVQSKFVVYANNIAFFLVSLLKVYFILNENGLVAFAVASLLDVALIGIILAIIYQWRGIKMRRWQWSKTLSYALLTESYPLIFSGIAIAIYMRIDQIMIPQLFSDTEAGKYVAAVKLTELWYFIPIIIKSSFFPSVINASEDEAIYRKMHRLFSLMVLISIAIALPLSIGSHWIVDFLYKDEFEGTASMLIISIWTLVFVSLGVARSAYLVAKNYIKQNLYFTIVGALVNVLLNFILIPKYGGNGAAISTLISYMIANYLTCFFYRPLFRIGKTMTRALFMPRV